MKKIITFVAVGVCLVALLGGVRSRVSAVEPASPASLPQNTPVPPQDTGSTVYRLPTSLAAAEMGPARVQEPVADPVTVASAGLPTVQQRAEMLRQAGTRFQTSHSGTIVSTPLSSPGLVACRQVLLNSQMNVTEFGDGTGSVESWAIMAQRAYFDNRPGYYRSPVHSLALMDDPTSDTVIISSTLDYDAFGQPFQSPSSLTVVTVTYSSLYTAANALDTVWGNLWTVDSDGYLDELLIYWPVGGGSSWTDRYTVVSDSAALAALSGKSLALVFDMYTNRVAPFEVVWLDDAQVTMCYTVGANTVFLPTVFRQPPAGPTCTPYEPDSKDARGYTVVGATCNGAFGATDIKDYYTLNLNGATDIRLQLSNLPAGTNWDAMIYENVSGYPLACHIATSGSQDKYKDCTLDPGKNYFVLVSAGTAPSGGTNTYQMSVTSRAAPPGGWTTITSQDFETSFPGAWSVFDNNASTNGEYYWARRNCRPYAGSYSGWAVGGGANGSPLSCGASYANYTHSWMKYGPFDLTGATAADMSFKLWLNSETNYDWVCWLASTNGTNFDGSCSSGSSAGWVDRTLDLSNVPNQGNLLGRSSVWVAIIFETDVSSVRTEGAYVDNIVLRKCIGTCTSLSVTPADPRGAELVELPISMMLEP